ncbi:N-acyl homoserine lactonase family protein (plasmid) [Agrobacterium tumefaciens]|uniref:N-acyl homoserine lactonase family protein n=1 Tax=Agrobacterium tumefaciens TaxID=358 RepID=UPI000E0B1247|nr:N-acyl homoserine lactonase family protein [Agrobacterium tumefaciens]WQE43329.1 N-acyl homoserine lactonase family protein [Agrobacterium tumefaciens]
MSDPSIWVLEYARSPVHPVSAVFYGSHNQGTMNLPFSYVLIKSGDVVALVDVGYDESDFGGTIAQSIGVTHYTPPQKVLSECGVSPDQITHIFVTHGHFDHMGGLRFFKNAKVFIQKKELESWMWILAKGRRYRTLAAGLNPADVLHLAEINLEGRLTLVEGVLENAVPGIDLYPAFNTHTAGCQYVVVRSDKAGKLVLSGDVIYTYKNLIGGDPSDPCLVPPGLANGSQTTLIECADEMLGHVDGNHGQIIPMHEERLGELFPSRTTGYGLKVVEVLLGANEQSRVEFRY